MLSLTIDIKHRPTHQLASETLQFAKRCGPLCDAAWNEVTPAFLWGCAGITVGMIGCFAGLATSSGYLAALSFLTGATILWVGSKKWRAAMRALKDFTAEMQMRRDELERRSRD